MRRETADAAPGLERTLRERAAPVGLPRYYALLFAPAEVRPALTALYAFDAEIRAAVHPGTEHAAAHLKLTWWREEIERLARGKPVHPIGRALHAAAEPLGLEITGLADYLVAAEHDLSARSIVDDDEFMGYVMQFGAMLQDGHVQFQIENSVSGVARYSIPILLSTMEGRSIVAAITPELSNFTGISEGDEILTVDGSAPADILPKVMKYRRTARLQSDKQFMINGVFSRRFYMTDLLPTKPMAEVRFKTASEETITVDIPWTVSKFSADLDKVVRSSTLNLHVPLAEEFNSMVPGNHAGQMGDNDPFFLTPSVLKKFKFIKIYSASGIAK